MSLDIYEGRTRTVRYDTSTSTATFYNADGTVQSTRALTPAEIALYSPDATTANGDALRTTAAQALAANRTFVAIASPTNAQVIAQVKALSRQSNGIIRLLLNQLDGTD